MDLKDILKKGSIDNTIEFLYVCMVGKYLKEEGKTLSLEGVDVSSIEETLSISRFYPYFKYAYTNKYFEGCAIKIEDYDGEESKLLGDFFMNNYLHEQPYFHKVEEDDEGVMHFHIDFRDSSGDSRNLMLFPEHRIEHAAVELIAYLHVHSIKTGTRYKLHPKIPRAITHDPSGVALLYYISKYRLDRGILELDIYSPEYERGLAYSAWYIIGQEQGRVTTEGALLPTKREELAKDPYKVGNVIFVYQRKGTSVTGDLVGKLTSSMIGVVRDRTENTITIERVPFRHTQVERKRRMKEEYSEAVQDLFRSADYEATTIWDTYNLTTLGVGNLLADDHNDFEETFITPVAQEGVTRMYVSQGGVDLHLEMGITDAVFWVLKDWGITFDEDLYISTYYEENGMPLYYQEMVDEFGLI